jgi:FtsZ-binding cell division protein ZapB
LTDIYLFILYLELRTKCKELAQENIRLQSECDKLQQENKLLKVQNDKFQQSINANVETQDEPEAESDDGNRPTKGLRKKPIDEDEKAKVGKLTINVSCYVNLTE